MFHPKKPFEGEKLQLQELNQRLAHYLSRSKLLEQENARLITEITTARHNRGEEWESKRMAELRETRRLVEKLSFEKHAAEMERDKLRKELHFLNAMRSDESSLSKGLSGELKGCEKQLRQALQTNVSLEERLIQLQNEYARLEDAHRNDVTQLRNQARSRVLPVIVQNYPSPPAFSAEEVQQYALSLSERWTDTFEMYREQVEKIEESIKEDQVRLEDIRREKMEYASELNRLRAEVDKHSRIQLELEEQLMDMQEKFRGEFSHYQVIVEELEHERMLLANTISEKLKDYQDLLKVKMSLGLELAAYRGLLEGEGRHAGMKLEQQSRERIIDIKMPAQFYIPRVPTMTTTQPKIRRPFLGYDVRNVNPISSTMTSTRSSQFKSHEPSRILPIIKQSQMSPAERRDMISFSKSRQGAGKPSMAKPSISAKESEEVIEKVTMIKGLSQDTPYSSLSHPQTATAETSDFTASALTECKSVRVVLPPMMGLNGNKEVHKKVKKNEGTEERTEIYQLQTVMKPDDEQNMKNESMDKITETDEVEAKRKLHETPFVSKVDTQEDDGDGGQKVFSEEKTLDTAHIEEIIEKVIKPAGLDAKLSPSADTKMTYHVEQTKELDGSTTTQIVLQSKVEEEVDLSEDSALDELLNKRVQQISLEDLEGTPTVSVIQNLISLGLKGESLENKSVKLEIIETPVDSHSEEEVKLESEEFEDVKSKPYFQPSSMLFHIEEPENEPQITECNESPDETPWYVKGGTVQVQEVSREEGLQITEHNESPNETSWYVEGGTVQVQDVSREEGLPYYSQGSETQEYFVSTPEDNMSGSEEGGGFMSYGHYGVVDDLSDERYYQDESLLTSRRYTDERESYRESSDSVKGKHFPECIIEEEVHVSPTMQESMLEILKEESLSHKEQLTGALEQLEGTVSGALKEELALLTKAREDSDISFNVKKVEQAEDNGTLTYVAEVSVSQSLEESGLFEDETDYPSQEQLMAALKSSGSDDLQALSAAAGGSYSIRVAKEEVQKEMSGVNSLEGTEDLNSAAVSRTEKVIRLGANERSFTFQMDVNKSSSGSDIEGVDFQGQKGDEVNVQQFVQTQMDMPALKTYSEKRIATVYLEKPEKE